MNKPELQVVFLHRGVATYWLTENDQRIGSDQRYTHPDCIIFFKGNRTHQTDHAVMIALQDAHMPSSALRYNKLSGK